jgi:small subunit ribosomal protein S16
MVKLRLRRVGAKKQASYRIVATDSRSPRDGRFIEVVGYYNPRTEPETVQIKEGRALYWLSVGAQHTEAVTRLLKKMGTLDRFERLKQGESMEALVAEAEAATEAIPGISPKTRRQAAAKKPTVEAEVAEAVEEAAEEIAEAEAAEAVEEEVKEAAEEVTEAVAAADSDEEEEEAEVEPEAEV